MFLAVGATSTLLGFALYTTLTLLVFSEQDFGYLLSLIVTYTIMIFVAFFLYRKLVYKVTGKLFSDFLKFVGVNMFSIISNLILLPILVQFTILGPIVSQALIVILTTIVSYFGHTYLSFKRT
jgi:putative flippase GtrA